MKLPTPKTPLWRYATILLVCVVLLACSLMPRSAGTATPPAAAPDQTIDAATAPSEQITEPANPVDATAPPATAGPYTLAVSDRYSYFEKIVAVGQSLAAREGTIWMGTVFGTLEKVDAQTGGFVQSISLVPEGSGGGGGMPMAYPIQKMAYEGDYLWVHSGWIDGPDAPPRLFALNPDSGEIVHKWDLNSPEWMQGYERGGTAADFGFGVSPGKIWIDGHIVDTQTFEAKVVQIPTIETLYTYDGKEWMWITAELGGSCADLILIDVNDPATGWCEDDWPFFSEGADGMGNPMVLAGDRIWMAGDWGAPDGSPYVLEAYPADAEQGMETTGPLLSVPSPDDTGAIKLFYAGDTLWALDTLGDDKLGWLFQIDNQTGEIVNSLDLVGEEARANGDLPIDIATEGDNLWVLTVRQLLRIKLP
jgi:hypothetical protein